MTERQIHSKTLDRLLIEMALKDKGLATGKIGDEMIVIGSEIEESKQKIVDSLAVDPNAQFSQNSNSEN